jgi:hypothetical protein
MGIPSPEQTSPTIARVSKRSRYSQGRGVVIVDSRTDKRVWQACERCRTKKTKVILALLVSVFMFKMRLTLYKCDGEWPCKRCKDEGLVCTVRSRKKKDFKQIPRG